MTFYPGTCENHPGREVLPPSRVLCAECFGIAVAELASEPLDLDENVDGTMLVTAEERYLVEKARSMRETNAPCVTTNHGVLLSYEEHRRLTEPPSRSDT